MHSWNFIDLSGKRFGRLLVLNPEDGLKKRNLKKRAYFLCLCDCGNEIIICSDDLRSGHTKSCGCLRKETSAKNIRNISKDLYSKPFGEASINRTFSSYKLTAKKKGILFELSREEFLELTEKECFYCGGKPSNVTASKQNNGDYIYNGIDRIDSSKGYITSNVITCCKKCNVSKNNYSQSDFFEWIKTVHSNLSSKGLI